MNTTQQTFDYIIVGAGSAGAVLAHRLTEDAGTRVLLLEAGGPDRHRLMQMPLGFFPMLRDPAVFWGYASEPEPYADQREILLPRGKVLGGSSSVNGMLYGRGHPEDYEEWSRLGGHGWGFADVLPYFIRAESNWRGASRFHGGQGPLSVSRHTTDERIFSALMQTARNRGHAVADDLDGSQYQGFGKPDFTVHHGRRGSTAKRYLEPVRHRDNLRVEIHALAGRILFEGQRAVGIEYRQNGRVHQVRAGREVILAGGAYNSPQLLMLSGIGRPDELRAAGIEPWHDLAGVGQNLQEHASAGASFIPREPIPLIEQMRFDRLALSVIRWKLFGTGVVANLPLASIAFYCSRPGLARPDIEFMVNNTGMDARVWFPLILPSRGNALYCGNIVLHPESRGWVKLRSADPAARVRIQLNLLQAEADRALLRRGLRNAREFFATAPIADLIERERLPGPAVQSDAEIDAYVRATIGVAHHACGTCAMGSGPEAVVDAELKVRGLEGLRVVDASIMPTVAGGHTNAVAIMIAEKAADLVRGRTLPPADAATVATCRATVSPLSAPAR
ncbi:MAG: GMC family oxidoreductase N-terminal domain-containing protein [Gammaproteobacteria bacterium]|nr:GMC family oxidoreductase N-terminal domain-containing protein [Gammaproteobacteria bacterium]